MKWGRVALGALLTGCPAAAGPGTQGPGGTADEADPQNGGVTVWPDEEFRAAAPKPGPAPELRIPEIKRFEMAGGIDVFLVEKHQLPTVTMRLTFPTGTVADPAGKRGMTSLCMSLLDEGTAKLDKTAFEEAQADLASRVFAFSNRETLGVGLSALKRSLEPTAALMVDVLLRPGLRNADLERLRSRRQAMLAQSKAAPASLGRRLWGSVVYGTDHPYGRLTSAKSLDAVNAADCRRLAKRLRPKGAQLFVAGAVSEVELRALLEEPLRRWTGTATAAREPGPPKPRKGTVFFVDIPGAAQSQIYVGHPGPARTAPDYEATVMMGGILGGSFSSRVNMNIRESKGFAYGARARFSYRKHGSAFAATTSVRSGATGEALRELAKEISRIRTSEVSSEELERERQGALLGLPARFSTAGRVLNTYSSLAFFGLPLDYYAGHQKRLSAVEIEDVQAAAAKHLRATDYRVLVIGDGEVVRKDLQDIAASTLFGNQGFVELDGDGAPVS